MKNIITKLVLLSFLLSVLTTAARAETDRHKQKTTMIKYALSILHYEQLKL